MNHQENPVFSDPTIKRPKTLFGWVHVLGWGMNLQNPCAPFCTTIQFVKPVTSLRIYRDTGNEKIGIATCHSEEVIIGDIEMSCLLIEDPVRSVASVLCNQNHLGKGRRTQLTDKNISVVLVDTPVLRQPQETKEVLVGDVLSLVV